MKPYSRQLKKSGFTIVELLIVIVVIGILVAISLVSYNGVQQSARDKSLLSDIENVSNELARYSSKNDGVYGSAVAWYSGGAANANIKTKPSSGNVIDVTTSKSDYCIRAFNPSSNNKTIATATSKGSTDGACDALFASTAAGGTGGGVVGWWKFNGNTVDDSDAARSGVAYNLIPTVDKLGNDNSAYSFNGSTSYLSLGTGSDYNYPSFSVSVWAKAVGTPGHVTNIIGAGNWNTENNWFIGFKTGGLATFVYGIGWSVGPQFSLASYDENQWVHYVGTVSPTQQKLYVNGALINDTKATAHGTVVNTYDLQIGRSSYTTTSFNGDIDDVRVYNREIPATVVTSMFNAGPK